ncbi:phage tail tape measure protein [Candidatus Binatus sp.]|uniref:phage tail tape measure protein n=1 Tax=Candidatus Binatus sp. TaxID=2811406 RepID=UPI003CBE2BA4
MALRDFLFGFKFLATDYVSPVLKNIERGIDAVNEQVKNTARWRETATNLGMLGAGMIGLGGGVGYVIKGFVDNAADLDEHLRHLSTTLDSGAAGVRELAQAHQLAAKWSVQYNYAQKDIIDNLYKSISFTGSYAAGLAVTNASLAVAKGNMGDVATTGQSLSIMLNDWPGKVGQTAAQAKHLADLVAYTSRHGPFGSVNDLTSALSIAAGSIKAAGLGPEDAMAMVQAYARVGLTNTEAGSAVIETLSAFSKGKLQKELGVALATTRSGALDVIGTMVNLRHEMGSGVITAQQFQRASAALGIRGERALAVDVNALVDFRKQLSNPNLINGAAMQGAMTMMGAFNEQMGSLGKRFDILSEALGTPLLGPITSIGKAMGYVLDEVTAFVNYAPGVAKWAVIGAAVGSAILVVGGGLLVATGALFAAFSFLPAMATVTAAVGGAFSFLGSAATFAWTAVTGPIGLAIIGIAAVAAAAYEVYEHWAAVKAFLVSWGSAATWKNLGMNILRGIGEGIATGAVYLLGPLGGVAKLIMDHFPHSPARLGPLRYLHQVHIVEELSRSIQPGPALRAIGRTAAAIAIAAPMVMSPMMVSPAMAGTSSGSHGGIVIQVRQEIRIDGAIAGDEQKLMAMLRHHGEELAEIIDRRIQHKLRRGF